MEERGLNGIHERKTVGTMMATPGLDQRGPFLELGDARGVVGLECEEGREGVGRGEDKGCCCCGGGVRHGRFEE